LLSMTRLARRLAPADEVDDIVQDALVRAWQKWDQFDASRGTATTWLLAITADQARASRRRRSRHLKVIDEQSPLPDRAADEQRRDLDLDRAVRGLAKRQRLAVELHYFVGLSVDETAEVMSCSSGTVKSTLHDARAALRDHLGDEHREH
jgi:RNA polymerase sigma-70 factor (ECF subfamily)